MPDSPSLPPEWAPQSALLLTWPHAHGDWGGDLPAAEETFLAIARQTASRQDLIIACYDEAHRAHVADALARTGVAAERVHLYLAPSNDIWVRDHGPITVLSAGRPTLLDFRFNGWGRKYPYQLDDAVTARLHEQGAFGDIPREAVSLVLEGGSIEVDGRGTLLTTLSCLLSPERNPAYDCIGLEGRFGELFEVHRTLWLEHGLLEGDDTDGHIDTLARFCGPHTIAYTVCDDPADSHYEPLQAMARQLAGFTDADGDPYRLVPLPLPAPLYDDEGRRLPANYANFLLINGAVLVPGYADPMDEVARTRLAEVFPERQVVTVDARALVRQNGSLHCAAMQVPAAVLESD